MGRGPFAKMDNDKFEYKDDDPVTISEEQKEVMKKNGFYDHLKKIQKNSLYVIMVIKEFGYGKTHAVIKERSDEKTK